MRSVLILSLFVVLLGVPVAFAGVDSESLYDPGQLKPQDSTLKVAVGEEAPAFTLPSIGGNAVSLADFRGRKNVMLSFVPAAWTPVCSDQWPGYNLARTIFEKHDTVVLGISVDNIPSLHAWIHAMGELWFPVLSDFWPHGKVADGYGLLRSSGTTERAIIIIDKAGIIRFIEVSDINRRPDLGVIVEELCKLK